MNLKNLFQKVKDLPQKAKGTSYKVTTEAFAVSLIKFSGICFLIIVIVFTWKRYTFDFNRPIDTNIFDHFGSFVSGIIGSILSLAGFILVYVALIEQKKTNLENKKEAEDAAKTQKYQRFENTFFQLLNFHNQIVNSFTVSDQVQKSKYISSENPSTEHTTEEVIYTGRYYFRHFYETMNLWIEFLKKDNKEITIISAYEEMFEFKHAELGHYFRHLYHIIKFVDKSDIEKEDKRTYTNLLRAQLSSYELIVIYYNGLSGYGKEKFKPLIEKYDLLQNMNRELIINDIVCSESYKNLDL